MKDGEMEPMIVTHMSALVEKEEGKEEEGIFTNVAPCYKEWMSHTHTGKVRVRNNNSGWEARYFTICIRHSMPPINELKPMLINASKNVY